MTSASESNFQQLAQRAQQVHKDLAAVQAELLSTRVEGVADGGLVRATLSGTGEIQDLEISPVVVDPDKTRELAEMIIVAQESLKSMQQQRLGPLIEGLGQGLPDTVR